MDACLYKYTKSHWIVHFKWVNYVFCELYLTKAVKIESAYSLQRSAVYYLLKFIFFFWKNKRHHLLISRLHHGF